MGMHYFRKECYSDAIQVLIDALNPFSPNDVISPHPRAKHLLLIYYLQSPRLFNLIK
jgi:hypothetical protein